jgi:glycosyltransferase involved in cell wall biosynthesis
MKIEVAIPCFNEELTVSKVVKDFKKALEGADIVVYDNNSTDRTAELAKEAGARVVRAAAQGKGNAVKQIFEVSDADIIVMVDGDDTYEAEDVKLLIEPVKNQQADMVIGTRIGSGPAELGQLHFLGNRVITIFLNLLFGTKYEDILSGYRVFNRRFASNVPLIGTGFEIESELMLQALENGMAVKELPIRFRKRPENSKSKLRTFGYGYRIIITIIAILRDHKPLFLFSLISLTTALAVCGVWTAGYFHFPDSTVFRLADKFGVYLLFASFALFLAGLVLNTVNVRMREIASLLKRKKQ